MKKETTRPILSMLETIRSEIARVTRKDLSKKFGNVVGFNRLDWKPRDTALHCLSKVLQFALLSTDYCVVPFEFADILQMCQIAEHHIGNTVSAKILFVNVSFDHIDIICQIKHHKT